MAIVRDYVDLQKRLLDQATKPGFANVIVGSGRYDLAAMMIDDVPDFIPEQYHWRIGQALACAYAAILVRKATLTLTPKQRHDIVNQMVATMSARWWAVMQSRALGAARGQAGRGQER